jgi:hypothetical protein
MIRRLLFVSLSCVALFSASTVSAQNYQGYVPDERAERGETWPDQTAAQIALCTEQGLKSSDLKLNRAQLQKWYAMCAIANRAHTAFVAGACWRKPHTPACVAAIGQDTAIRQDESFWGLIDAMRSDTIG